MLDTRIAHCIKIVFKSLHLQASINIPSVSERTVRRMNQAKEYDKGPSIQVQ